MQVLVGSRHLDLHVSQAPQAAGDGGGLHRDHRSVRYQYNIGLEHLLVLLAEFVKTRRADLLLALQHEFHVAGQALLGAHRLERLGVHPQLALVVVGAAAPDTAVADDTSARSAPAFTSAAASHSAHRVMSGRCSLCALIEGMRKRSNNSLIKRSLFASIYFFTLSIFPGFYSVFFNT